MKIDYRYLGEWSLGKIVLEIEGFKGLWTICLKGDIHHSTQVIARNGGYTINHLLRQPFNQKYSMDHIY